MTISADTDTDTGEARPARSRRKKWLFVALAALSVIVIGASAYAITNPWPAGDELDLKPGWAYGWYTSKDIGSVFTDGLNTVNLTSKARGPLRLISARPLMDNGGALRVLGVLARVNPDMLATGFSVGGFQDSPGFPPTFRDAAGAVPVNGLIVEPSKPGQARWIELQIGYEVVAPGRSARRGIELIYEYEGIRRKAVIPSYVAICAPATIMCRPETAALIIDERPARLKVPGPPA